MTDHADLLQSAESYALGALDAEERARFEAHLPECDECAAAVARAREVADLLSDAVDRVRPSPTVRDRLLARVRAEADPVAAPAPPIPSPWPRRIERLALAASLAGLLWLGWWNLDLTRRLDAERERLTIARIEGARLDSEMAGLRELLGRITAEQTRAVTLAGQGPLPEASARAYLEPRSQRLVLFVYDLPPLPEGQTYQLWVITGGRPVNAGVFEIDAAGRARYEAEDTPQLEGEVTIAVTIEPGGGVPQPTGPIVLAGT